MQDITLVLLAMVKMAKIFVACAVPTVSLVLCGFWIYFKVEERLVK